MIEVFSRGPGRTTCVSCVEVLCKVVLSLACMSCSCRLITARSVTLARAPTRMRRLFRQQQAVRVALQSYSLITPARGSLVSALSFVASITLLPGPLCDSVFSLFCFLFGGHSHNDAQDVIMHVISVAGSDPTSLCFCFFWLGCGCVFLVCLVSFRSGYSFLVPCWDSSLDCVQVHYQYFCGYRQLDSLA